MTTTNNGNNVENPLEICVKVDDWVIWRYVLKRILQISFENVGNPLEICVKVKKICTPPTPGEAYAAEGAQQ